MVKAESPVLSFFLVRHGQSSYTQKWPDLTLKGKIQSIEAGKELCGRIKGDVIFWSSPTARTRGTAHIIRKTLQEEGKHTLKRRSNKKILRPFDVRKGYEKFADGFYNLVHERGMTFDSVFANDPLFARPNFAFESRPEITGRINSLMDVLTQTALKRRRNQRQLSIIATTHFEILHLLADSIYGIDPYRKEGPHRAIDRGEIFQLDFYREPGRREVKIEAQFRDLPREAVIFPIDKPVN